MGSETANLPPHVLIFPLPIQGRVNSMLRLAELLCLADLDVTYIVSEFCHNRLLQHTSVASRFARYPGFSFQTISDGLPDDHPLAGEGFVDIMPAIKKVTGPLFKQMMTETNCFASAARRPVTCIIADGVLSSLVNLPKRMEFPLFTFALLVPAPFGPVFVYLNSLKLETFPLKGMDLLVKSVPGMENIVRRRDLPGFCHVNDLNETTFQIVKTVTRQTPRAQAVILNTFEDLEAPILSQIRKHMPRLYTIGPNHFHLTARLGDKITKTETETLIPSGSLWKEDRSCLAWLDSQPPKSVIYVSFGSITVVTRDQLVEFWYGLVNSGQRFLWVMRPDSIMGEEISDQIPEELEEGTKARGYMVGWAPQQEVLNHAAIGGFFTHSGWNSTLESMVVGVPMICWPYFADQTINSRFVSEIWKLGLDMKHACDRVVIEKMIRELMDVRKDEFLTRADAMAILARKAVTQGGTSYNNLDSLVEFIKSTIIEKGHGPMLLVFQ